MEVWDLGDQTHPVTTGTGSEVEWWHIWGKDDNSANDNNNDCPLLILALPRDLNLKA